MENMLLFYQSMPPVTRTYITACVLTTLGVQLDLISPFQLYFNFKLIFLHHQYWRLITTFLFFGTFSFTFMFNMMFTYRYSRMLEEGSFRSNSADFFFMLLFGAILMILIAPFVKLLFLGHAFTIMLVYVWAKRNTHIQLSLFGLFNFRAPHLPWILLGFSLILGNSVLTDVLGISIGHIYYYLQDVFPYLPGGFRCLKTPKFIVYCFNPSEYYMDRLNSHVHSANPANDVRNEVINEARNEVINETNLSQSTNESNQSTSNQSESNKESENKNETNRENENTNVTINQVNGTTKSEIKESKDDKSIQTIKSGNSSNEVDSSINKDELNNQSLRNRTENKTENSTDKTEESESKLAKSDKTEGSDDKADKKQL